MSLVYADVSGIVDGQTIDAADVIVPITNLDEAIQAVQTDVDALDEAIQAVQTDVDALDGVLALEDQIIGENIIYNGNMDVWQEGTSFTNPVAGTSTAEGWQWTQTEVLPCTITRSTDVPNARSTYSLRLTVTTGDATIASGTIYAFSFQIEGYNIRELVGQPFTLSFWVRSSVVGTYSVALRNTTPDRSYTAEYTIEQANTWEYKTITFPDGLTAAGTWNYTTGIGLRLNFALAAGSGMSTAPEAWATGSYMGSTNQVNAVGTNGNIFALAQVKLEPGLVATPFVPEPYNVTLRRCQRYFWKSYDSNVAPGTASSQGYAYGIAQSAAALSVVGIIFPTEMRVSPTITVYSYNGTAGKVSDISGVNVGTGTLSAVPNHLNRLAYMAESSNPFTTNSHYMFHLTANARL